MQFLRRLRDGVLHQPADVGWILCLNRKSSYCFETVDALFSCPAYERSAHHNRLVERTFRVSSWGMP